MSEVPPIVVVVGPTASGKSGRAVERALQDRGEVISVDSRQVYRMLDIGTEKITPDEMRGIPHHLIDIRDPRESYSAGDFVTDATRLIEEIRGRGNLPILAGGTHFYIDALLYGLPAESDPDPVFRAELETEGTESLLARLNVADPRRAAHIDPQNRRRIIRALEIARTHGHVPERANTPPPYDIEWVVVNPERDVLYARIETRLQSALERGLVEEVRRVREYVGDERLNELGLEYRIVGEYLRGERDEASLLPALLATLSQYARRQRAWLRKLGR